MKKIIVGKMVHKSGQREAFIQISRTHMAATRAEPGCEFFDISLSLDEPDTAHVAECFTDEAAHEAHNATPHMLQFRDVMSRILVSGTFHNIYSDQIVTDRVAFD